MTESNPVSNLIELSGGSFLMGNELDAYPADGEGPIRETVLSPFSISSTAVTNAEFAAFVAATNYVTTAEQNEDNQPPWSFVFAGLLPDDFPPTRGVLGAEWWRQVEGADWFHPEGPNSELEAGSSRWTHPVVHVSWFDAIAFAEWADSRLPTEAEWEFAARGSLNQKRFPWGDESNPDGDFMCNIFTGSFPDKNTAEDGWFGTCPVDAFPANNFGLYNCSGNVWEWCNDWFSARHKSDMIIRDPEGPSMGLDKVVKGGSYLCHDSYCNRYRVGARMGLLPNSSLGHQGFRIAR
jgi:formylglycine-generating enzyme required for sulfatase activity|tara:strand:- start:926 stop:1807 length:882 start_codon:yes stop_codon:yes gene_type:complete